MIVLGIDPGYAIVGFGLVRTEGPRVTHLGHGVIRTPAGMPFDRRLFAIYTDMRSLLERYKPDEMAVEQLFFNTNTKTAIHVAQARGVVVLSAAERAIPVMEYTPLQVKMAVVGFGQAVKKQVMEMTRSLLGLDAVPRPDDAADALAVAICHSRTTGSALAKFLDRNGQRG